MDESNLRLFLKIGYKDVMHLREAEEVEKAQRMHAILYFHNLVGQVENQFDLFSEALIRKGRLNTALAGYCIGHGCLTRLHHTNCRSLRHTHRNPR